jgi:hypothetical protein
VYLRYLQRRIGHAENVAEVNPEDVQFVAGDSLTNLVADPSERNFRLWLEKEKDTPPTQQSVILLVSEKLVPRFFKLIIIYKN